MQSDTTRIIRKKIKNFEKEIASIYESGKIKSPIHLDGSIDNKLENFLIDFFQKNKIDKNTWVASTHRSHLLWLLSRRDPEELKRQILEGHSMHIFGHKFITSSIVGGICPIALGIAKSLAMMGSNEKIYCFIGDMAATSGLFSECIRYAEGWNLPIMYIVLDNKYSVRVNTKEVWGVRKKENKVIKISYKRKYPHAGSGKYVMF